jgi:hypothetical protein
LLALGLGLRLYHYLCDPSVWHDEAALILNVLGKSFPQLLGPLFFSEAAPPLFLWLEKTVTLALGPGTYACRLLPCLAGCASLVALVAVAKRTLCSAVAVCLAALLFACSDRLLWHGCEAKPYIVDVLVATSLLATFVWSQAFNPACGLAAFTCLTPVMLWLSYPACFLLGGLGLSLLPAVVRARCPRAWLLYTALLVVLGTSFLLLLMGPIHAQRDGTIVECWQDVFPRWERRWTVPGWMVMRLVEVFRYAWEPTGGLLAPVAGVGAVVLWRQRQRRLVAFLVWPIVLAGAAGLLGQYPFGATRVMAFAAPAAVLLLAAGLPPALAQLRRLGLWAPALLAAITLFPVLQAAYRVCCPWPRADAARAAAFVREHWRPGDIVLGTAWEHSYYFRDWGGDYQLAAHGSEVPPACARLWLLAGGKTTERQGALLRKAGPVGVWRVVEQKTFVRTTVFCLGRAGVSGVSGRGGGR